MVQKLRLDFFSVNKLFYFLILFHLQLSIDDNLPKLICHKCNYLVEQSFKFHKEVEKTYTFLCNHIKETTASEVEPEYLIIESEIETPISEEVEEEVESYENYEFLDNEDLEQIDECPICMETVVDCLLEHLLNHDQHQDWNSFFKNKMFQKYICNICENQKEIKRRYEFIIHMRRHLKIKPYKCPDCDLSFYSSNLLKMHSSKGHCNMNCSTCLEIFTDKTEFTNHIKNVHKQTAGEKKFNCSYCDKQFTSTTNLKTHEKLHTEVGKFKCTMCDKFYHRKSDLTRHLNVHLGKKPYKCSLCETSFFTRPELNRHMIYHNSIRSFQCTFCDKSFYESGHLAFHQKTIHFKIKEFSCEFCQKDFSTSHKLKRHQMAKSCLGNKQQQQFEEEEENPEIINFIGQDQNLPMQILINDFPTDDLQEFTINNFDGGICMEIDSRIDDNFNMNSEMIENNYEIVNIANGPVMDGKKINVIGLRNFNDEIQNYLLVEESLDDENNPFVFNETENI